MCCGCGCPEQFWKAAQVVLEHFSKDWSERDSGWVYASDDRYFVVNALDSVDLLEHGSGIGGSWLSDSGKEALAFLREHGPGWCEEPGWEDSEGTIITC